ncbi:MAG: ATP-binding protein [Myxococcota bacterium]|nr:ATP-binding protein [Myxococcota bacterium]
MKDAQAGRKPFAKTPLVDTVGLRLVWVMLLRVGLISVLLGATLVFNYKDNEPFFGASTRFLLSIIAAVYALTIVYGVWYRTGNGIRFLARLQLGLDLAMWSSLAYATGGIGSGFTFLFDLWVVLTAAMLGGRAAFYFAGWATLVLAALAGLMALGWLQPLADQLRAELSFKDIVYFFVLNATALFVVATLVTHLVSRLELTSEGLAVERTKRADLAVLYTDTIRSLSAGLVTTGRMGEIVTINPMGREILGITDERVEGQALSEWLKVAGNQAKLPLPLEPRGFDEAKGPDGDVVPVEYIVSPLLGADGGQRGAIVIFSDLSEVRRLEEALERSRRLAALGELAAGLAHEIRNPLGAVSGAVQMLVTRADSSQEDEALGAIVLRELARMERLVTDMLDFARPSRASRHPTNFSALAREVVTAFAQSAEAHERHIVFASTCDAEIEADGSRIKQVVWNLLRNAVQATGVGGHVTLRVYQEPSHVVLDVQDDGPGIDPKLRDKLFDPFFTSRERGIGIGLALCRRIIVEEHRGTIEVAQTGGPGALLRVRLPL